MTDEVSQPASPPLNTALDAVSGERLAQDVLAESTPTPPPAEPVISPEAVKEISQVITEGLQETLAEPVPAPEVTPPEPAVPTPAPTSPPPPAEPVAAPSTASAPTTSNKLPATSYVSAGPHMRQVVQSRKQARLERIMEMANRKRVITNNDVEREFNVSDSTATRDLEDLEKAYRLKKTGIRASTKYEPI